MCPSVGQGVCFTDLAKQVKIATFMTSCGVAVRRQFKKFNRTPESAEEPRPLGVVLVVGGMGVVEAGGVEAVGVVSPLVGRMESPSLW